MLRYCRVKSNWIKLKTPRNSVLFQGLSDKARWEKGEIEQHAKMVDSHSESRQSRLVDAHSPMENG